MTPDYTVVIALDERTAQFFAHSYEVWRKLKPDLLERPWLVIYDRTQIKRMQADFIYEYLTRTGPNEITMHPWGTGATYASQREKMLTAFVHVPPALVTTEWWCKIDVDALPERTGPWYEEDWFDSDTVMIGHRWGYTKPKTQMAELDDWGDRVTALSLHPRLNLPVDEHSNKCRHARVASWIFFCRTAWSQMASELTFHTHGPTRIPVPSQDGYHWYVAARRGDSIRRVKWTSQGWSNHAKLEKLKRKAEELRGT